LNDARGLVGDKVRDNLYPPVESSSEAFFEQKDLWKLSEKMGEILDEKDLRPLVSLAAKKLGQ
jgi:hypothetical protein